MRDEVDTTVNQVPVPKYYLARHQSGLWNLVEPVQYGRVEHGGAESVETLCGETLAVEGVAELKLITDWLTPDDVLGEYSADELWDALEPFRGQCENCRQSHMTNDPDFAQLQL